MKRASVVMGDLLKMAPPFRCNQRGSLSESKQNHTSFNSYCEHVYHLCANTPTCAFNRISQNLGQ